MKPVFTEEHEDIKPMKSKEFVSAVTSRIDSLNINDFWISPLMTMHGDYAGWFCNFSDDDYSYHLQNDKGAVRVFKTVESAMNFYRGIVTPLNGCMTSVFVGLV